MTPALLDHLWQSTLFAGGVWLLTLCLKRNPARLRFRLWFAASLKFLVPFAALSALGESLSRLFPTTVPRLVLAIQPAAERFSAPARALAGDRPVAGFDLVPVLAALWLAGFAAVLAIQGARWLKLRAVMHQARDARIAAPVDVKASPSLLEPGLVGILHPVVLLPEGLMARLSKAERDAILAHELSHFSSGDNITAAIHMLVEALFWFYPPVWLIGKRLIVERERACDESVLADGHDAEVYAQSILKVCRFCIQSPLACAPGASGADLDRRVRQIMSDEVVFGLSGFRKALLATALAIALGLPVAEGFVSAPPMMAAMQQRVAASRMAASILQAAVEAGRMAAAPPLPKARHRLKIVIAAAQPAPPPPAETATPPAPPPADATAAPAPAPIVITAPQAAMKQAQVKEILTALYPEGAGDPEGVTCRFPEALPGSRLPGPKVCETNRQWASLRAQHEDIAPDGQSIIMRDGSLHNAGYVVPNCKLDRVTNIGPSGIGLPGTVCF